MPKSWLHSAFGLDREYSFEYDSNGNVKKVTEYFKILEYPASAYTRLLCEFITHDTKINFVRENTAILLVTTLFDLNFLSMMREELLHSKNNCTQAKYYEYGGDATTVTKTETLTFEYEYNQKGYPTKIRRTSLSPYSENYKYECK